jgi:hypothetical protein
MLIAFKKRPFHAHPASYPLCPEVLNQVFGSFNIRETDILAPKAQAALPTCLMYAAYSPFVAVDGMAPVVLVEEGGKSILITGSVSCKLRCTLSRSRSDPVTASKR